ncbi:hypothetical protein B0H16DRAFT_1899491 [Mycena metata]|uniref:Uncharacterized protein n=1 Tax=Mycena metata TaxID=1033252 RepID=A0AAD7H6Z3_9AGAR|nr:hypothetical protein B0H16DRAFT_1899491 [Mycena metata]
MELPRGIAPVVLLLSLARDRALSVVWRSYPRRLSSYPALLRCALSLRLRRVCGGAVSRRVSPPSLRAATASGVSGTELSHCACYPSLPPSPRIPFFCAGFLKCFWRISSSYRAFPLSCTARSIAPVLLLLPDLARLCSVCHLRRRAVLWRIARVLPPFPSLSLLHSYLVPLWPIFHYLLWPDIASEDTSQDTHYAAYAATNQAFAERIESDLIYIPSYRLLLPDAYDSLVIGLFVRMWHGVLEERGVGCEM